MTKFTFNGNEFYIDDKLGRVIEIFVKKYEKNNDNLLIISGNTGTGKSNLATLCCAYYSYLTKIPYDVSRVYFNSKHFVKESISTNCQIFHYDESLFSAMAVDWQTKEQKELIKMLLLCRKKRHFYVFCIPDFFKLKDTIKVEKCNGLIYTSLRKSTPGRFMYFRGKKREALLSDYRKTNRKRYSKFKSFRGTFARVLPKIIDEVVYDRNKDKAIMELMPAEKLKDKGQEKLDGLKLKLSHLPKFFGLKQKDVAHALGLSPKHFAEWKHLEKKEKNLIPNSPF